MKLELAHLTAYAGHNPAVNGDWQLVLWLTLGSHGLWVYGPT